MKCRKEYINILAIFIIITGIVFQGCNKENDSVTTDDDAMTESSAEINDTESVLEISSEEHTEEVQLPKEYLIKNFNIVFQKPELPTGCEITATTMIINYYGFSVDKMTMALEYMPTLPAEFYYGADGLMYGNDMESYFIGDPRNKGYVCGITAIATAVNNYFVDIESSMKAVDISGSSVEKLYNLVSQDIPVLVYVTIGMKDRAKLQGWYTESGDYMEWSTNDHGAVLIGFSEDQVVIADPISGIVRYNREQFEKVFASRGNKCAIIQ